MTVLALMAATVWLAIEPTAPARLLAHLTDDVAGISPAVLRFVQAVL